MWPAFHRGRMLVHGMGRDHVLVERGAFRQKTQRAPASTTRSPSMPPVQHTAGTKRIPQTATADCIRRRPGAAQTSGVSLREKKKVFRFPKKARGHSVGGWQLATGGWWRLVVVGGGWWLAVGGWRQLAVVGSWRLVAAGGWRRLVAGGWWRLVVGCWWRLAVDGSWRLAVGGPLGLSLRAVLSKKKKKISSLKDAPAKHPEQNAPVAQTNLRQAPN